MKMLKIKITIFFILFQPTFKLFAQRPDIIIQSSHNRVIKTFALSHNKKILATSEEDNSVIKFWDMTSKLEYGSVASYGDFCNLQFSENDLFLATITTKGTVNVFRTSDFEKMYEWDATLLHSDQIKSQFEPGGTGPISVFNEYYPLVFIENRYLIIPHLIDSTSRISWELVTIDLLERTVEPIISSSDTSQIIDFNVFLDKIIILRNKRKVQLYDLTTAKLNEYKIPIEAFDNSRILFSNYGKLFIISSSDKIFSFLTENGKLKDSCCDKGDLFTTFSDTSIVALHSNGLISVTDTRTDSTITKIIGYNHVTHLDKLNDKSILLSQSNRVYSYNIVTGEVTTIVSKAIFAPNFICSLHNGHLLVSDEKSILEWDIARSEIISEICCLPDYVYSATVSNDEHYIAINCKSLTNGSVLKEYLVLYDLISKKLISVDSSISWVYSDITFSPDSKYIAVNGRDSICQYECTSGKKIHSLTDTCIYENYVSSYRIYEVAYYTSDSELITLSDIGYANRCEIKFWSPRFNKPMKLYRPSENYLLRVMDISPNRKFIAVSFPEGWRSELFNLSSSNHYYIEGNAAEIRFAYNDSIMAIGSFTGGKIRLINVETGELHSAYTVGNGRIYKLAFSKNNKFLYAIVEDGYIAVVDIVHKTHIANLFFGKSNLITVLDNGYFSASKSNIKSVAFVADHKPYFYDQFDLYYDRPDIVLQALSLDTIGFADLHRIYQKRLELMGLTEEMVKSSANLSNLPEVNLENEKNIYPDDSGRATIIYRSYCSTSTIKRINIWVNDVPIYGKKGRAFKQELDTVVVDLNSGNNRIQISCLDNRGLESLKRSISLQYSGKRVQTPKVYFIGIGIQYPDKIMNLKYTIKDIQDFASVIKTRYSKAEIHIIHNEGITDSLLKIKRELMLGNPDDMVIALISGHGSQDQSGEFYLVTNSDHSTEKMNGIPYEEIENLFDSIPARKKLLLIDACQSGDKINLALLRDKFIDVSNGTGTQIMSATSSEGYAYRSDDWKNGAFTYSIINGLCDNAADEDKDGRISISELRNYAYRTVMEITHGTQVPVTRKENIENDWLIW